MDRRSWPWKKKTSEKAVASSDSAVASFFNSTEHQTEKDDAKNEKLVQITMETYVHLTGLDDQVKALNEKLLSVELDMTAKDDLVKQHAKVAEEAVSGWEKAEAEALALKQQLESVTLLKLTAEEKSVHLDGALKECMKQIRNVKDESEQKLHDVVFSKTKQWEKIKADLEARIINFEQELHKLSGENSALSRSLQERTSLLMKVREEKSQADAHIEVLKNDIHSCEREVSSMKYELHVISKELEIRNEEKNMSMRSADAANKQHLEGVKKITKLEAECQRLRGLVRKKLPGPGALAQMKLEVENLGREYGESRLRRSPSKSSSPRHALSPDFALENIQQVHKENEFLTARLLTMEEEMKMLKEALSKRNSELQASRNMCAEQANKLCSMETNVLVLNQQKSPLQPNIDVHFENKSNLPSFASISEDGIGEEGSCSESWATALISELSSFKKEKYVDKVSRVKSSNNLELMDDFLEMEKLACSSTKSEDNINMNEGVKNETMDSAFVVHTESDGVANEGKWTGSELSKNLTAEHASTENDHPHLELKTRIISVLESQANGTDMKRTIENIRHIIQYAPEEFLKEVTETADDLAEKKHCHRDIQEIPDDGFSLKHDGSLCTEALDQQMKDAISHIHEFVLSLGKDASDFQNSSNDFRGLYKKIEEFSVCIDGIGCYEVGFSDFILALSHILLEASDLGYRIWTPKDNEGESNGSDCIDKETLLENKVTQHEPMKESISRATSFVPHSSFSSEFEIKTTLPTLSLVDFEQMKLEKERMEMDLTRCKEMLNQTNFTLVETEQQLSVLKLELASCQKSNSLAETQLKCMVESYKILESQKEELETEMCHLHAKVETMDNELQAERHSHQEDIGKYKELQEQLERNMKGSTCSFTSNADCAKTQQEMDIAAAAEKLAECQETIFLLGRQLQAMRNPAEPIGSSPYCRPQLDDHLEDEKDAGCSNPRVIFSSMLSDSGDHAVQVGGESPLNLNNSHMSPSDTESSPFNKSPISTKHQYQKSYKSPSLSGTTPDKHGRGFSRFFSRGRSER